MKYDYDLFVIGAGSAGVRMARMSAQFGAKVAIAEDLYLGGTCVNVGCVPKKLFVYASEFSTLFQDAQDFGWQFNTSPTFFWQTLLENKNREIERLNGVYENLLNQADVSVLNGTATITGPNSVEINGEICTADKIVIATGGWPFVPDFPGREHVITSNEVFYLKELPKSVTVVGGGYIAVEFAGVLHGLGVEVDLIYRRDLFLRGFDDDVRAVLKDQMMEQGIRLHFEANVSSIEAVGGNNGYRVNTDRGETLDTDIVLYATGRKPKTADLGMENTSIKLGANGEIPISAGYQTAEPSIYALGDVTDRIALTPVAIHEAMYLSRKLFGVGDPEPLDYSKIPSAVFSHPNIGTVGLTESEARSTYQDIKVFKSQFRALNKTLGASTQKTFLKLIVDADSDRVVGCHMVGDHAGEIIQGIAVALTAGATKRDFDRTVGVHPTIAEEFVTMRQAER